MELHPEVPADLSPEQWSGLGIHAFRSLMLTVLVGLLAACGSCEVEDIEAPVDLEPQEEPLGAADWEDLDSPAPPDALGANLHAAGDTLWLSWIEPIDAEVETHAVRVSALRQGTWTEPSDVTRGEGMIASWADFPRTQVAGGHLYVNTMHRAGDSPWAYETRLWRASLAGRGSTVVRAVQGEGAGGAGAQAPSGVGSGNRLLSFDALGVVHSDGTPTEHGFVSMVPEGAGIRLFWLDGRAGPTGGSTAVYSTTADAATAAGGVPEAEQVDPRVCDCCQTAAAVSGDGALVVYRDRDDAEVRDISIARRTEAGFQAPHAVHEDAWTIAGCPVNGPSIAADGDDVWVTWFTGADGGSVRLARSRDGGATFTDPVTIDEAQPPGRVSLTAIHADGDTTGVLVVWMARANGGEIRARFVGNDGVPAAPTRVASSGTDRDHGFPVVAEHEGHVYVAYRTVEDGLGRIRIRRVSTSDLGALEPAEDGAPVVALEVGADIPDVSLRGADDASASVRTMASEKPTVMAFYASWCQPCRAELGVLETLRAAHPELHVVAVSLDEGPHARAEAVARRWGFLGDVYRDEDASSAFGVPPLPGTFVFADGKVTYAATGGFERDALWRAVGVDPPAGVESSIRASPMRASSMRAAPPESEGMAAGHGHDHAGHSH